MLLPLPVLPNIPIKSPFEISRLIFSIVLFGRAKKNDDDGLDYGFETQNNGENTCKSPMGMFEDFFIPNDLQYVKECIQKYEE